MDGRALGLQADEAFSCCQFELSTWQRLRLVLYLRFPRLLLPLG